MSPAGTSGWEAHADVVVVGSGVAGLTAALTAHERGLRVLVVSKAGLHDSATAWAQGGIAVVDGAATAGAGTTAGGETSDGDTADGDTAGGDTVEAHVADTLAAGAGLCDEAAVRSVVGAGAGAVRRLVQRGAVFDRAPDGSVARTREGGHRFRRVVHAGGDATGAEVQRALGAATQQSLPGPAVLEHHHATRVLLGRDGSVHGLAVTDAGGALGVLHAPAVVLATGGLGHLYAVTTNPTVATGDGIALALAAGAVVSDLELVQFHPTVLFTAAATGQRPLVTEAVRGEGARLVGPDGASVTSGVHPLGDLAPRDVVAGAITAVLARTGAEHVWLDARAVPDLRTRFPTVHAACAAVGIDPARAPIPVAPAAHYSCGGVRTDVHGRTGVEGLYAAGEVARTGLHGANRLASNSLLEGLVMAERVAAAAAERVVAAGRVEAAPVLPPTPAPVLDRTRLQHLMSAHAGIGRDATGLGTVADALTAAPLAYPLDQRAREDATLTTVAEALVAAATWRTESRGCHVRTDSPASTDSPSSTGSAALPSLVVLDRETGRPTVVPQDHPTHRTGALA
ncbi:L-aspartate oxidase [Rhodococcus sp. X156]|uniref:L-aspartate oxidase n=1 Tax=Rhodococcus sp. X156 TaxID=2499145 RepID=UPI000FDA75D9|nr:L-aspartate oxidase [Rhodococcus sp. X156]